MKKLMFAIVGAAILVSSGALAQMDDAKAACNKDAEAWRMTYNNHDADALANMYEAKAGMFSSEFWTGTGHDAILAGFKAQMSAGGPVTSIICDHSNKTGATIVSDGAWAATMKGPDGKDAPVQGHWMAMTETRNGKDVVLVHISNMQMPQPQAMK